MSGGFFRGTSADQDTRFSNKQAKLLKTQKFAPELEHLVDITKVKMDVIKPWIAKKVTEFLGGFEDEVLINFIYGLLEGKEINGKEVQIQLTGFMEKNTGKFMKELWTLLLSAQKNASGVPQQFLDAKEEETKKKKAESDRIFDEIQRRKEKEIEPEKERKMDGELDNFYDDESNKRHARGSDPQSGEENGADVRNGFRGRNRSSMSPYSSDHSPSSQRGSRSNYRSDSKERSISRSNSGSPRPRRRSVSPVRTRRTPRRSVSPRRPPARESISPRRGSYSRKRSSSRTRYTSPFPMRRRVHSPVRRRSPSPPRRRSPYTVRRRSPSPLRRRSRSPLRRRSPPRRRPRSPWWRRSPSPRRRRSPSPVRQRRRRSTSSPRSASPGLRRSGTPVRRQSQSPIRRSPYQVRRRSPSPHRRDSPSPRGRRSPSPVRRRLSSPVQRSPVRARRRSPARLPSRSLSPASRSSASPVRDGSVSPIKMKSPGLQKPLNGSPRERNGAPRERTRLNDHTGPAMMTRRQPTAMSPMRDDTDGKFSRRRAHSVSPLPEKSPSYNESPMTLTRTSGENRRFASPHKRAGNQMVLDGSQSLLTESDQRVRAGSPGIGVLELEIVRDDKRIKHKSIEAKFVPSSGDRKRDSPEKGPSHRHDGIDSRQKDIGMASVEVSLKEALASKKSPQRGQIPREMPIVSSMSDEKRSSRSKNARDNSKADALINSNKKQRSPIVHFDSGSEESDKKKPEISEKRKHRRSSRREALSDDTSSESEIEGRKEAKRRKKEEKKLRKEERRRRREERRRRKEEKRASKRKRKSKDADYSSSDIEKNEKDDSPSDGERGMRKYLSEEEETESQKKRLEIELREKALESLRAKKGISR